MLNSEELGVIFSRIILSDENFRETVLRYAEEVAAQMTIDDIDKLEGWADRFQIFCCALEHILAEDLAREHVRPTPGCGDENA